MKVGNGMFWLGGQGGGWREISPAEGAMRG